METDFSIRLAKMFKQGRNLGKVIGCGAFALRKTIRVLTWIAFGRYDKKCGCKPLFNLQVAIKLVPKIPGQA